MEGSARTNPPAQKLGSQSDKTTGPIGSPTGPRTIGLDQGPQDATQQGGTHQGQTKRTQQHTGFDQGPQDATQQGGTHQVQTKRTQQPTGFDRGPHGASRQRERPRERGRHAQVRQGRKRAYSPGSAGGPRPKQSRQQNCPVDGCLERTQHLKHHVYTHFPNCYRPSERTGEERAALGPPRFGGLRFLSQALVGGKGGSLNTLMRWVNGNWHGPAGPIFPDVAREIKSHSKSNQLIFTSNLTF